jgi:hypothetical protein
MILAIFAVILIIRAQEIRFVVVIAILLLAELVAKHIYYRRQFRNV